MARCPKYLEVDNFDRLANSMNLKLTDNGVSALGEIIEFVTMQLLSVANKHDSNNTLDIDAILKASEELGINISVDQSVPIIKNARLGGGYDTKNRTYVG